MSKIWLIVLLVASVQFAHSFPTDEFELESDEDNTVGILKDAWAKLKDRWTTVSKDKLKQMIKLLNDRYCLNQNDFEEDFDDVSMESDEVTDALLDRYKQIIQTVKDLITKAKAKVGNDKQKLAEEMKKVRAQVCEKLGKAAAEEDFSEDDEENTVGILKDAWAKLKDRWTTVSKDKLKQMIKLLNERYCLNQNDFEEDFEDVSMESDEVTDALLDRYKQIIQTAKDLIEKAKAKVGNDKQKLDEELKKVRAQVCEKLGKAAAEEDFSEDDEENTVGIIKDAWAKLKDRWTTVSKDKLKQMIKLLNDRYCLNQNDFEEDFEDVSMESDEVTDAFLDRYKQIIKTAKDLIEKAKAKVGNDKQKLDEELKKVRAQVCEKLGKAAAEEDFSEDEGDDEERGLFSKKPKVPKTPKVPKPKKSMKDRMKNLKEKMKEKLKKGAEMLKNLGVKINMMECEEKTCKSCIGFSLPGVEKIYCISMRFMRTNKNTYIVFGVGKQNKPPAVEQKLKLGELPRCVKLGELIGKVCVKAIEGRAKTSKGKPQVNFCLGMIAEKFGVGCKFCATYQDKKLRVKFKPSTFAGSLDDDNDIVVLDGENGVSLDADEFEVDDDDDDENTEGGDE